MSNATNGPIDIVVDLPATSGSGEEWRAGWHDGFAAALSMLSNHFEGLKLENDACRLQPLGDRSWTFKTLGENKP